MSELKERSFEITQSEEEQQKWKHEKSPWEWWQLKSQTNKHILSSRGEENEKGMEDIKK